MKKLLFIALLQLLAVSLFAQEDSLIMEKTRVLEIKNPRIGIGANTFNSDFTLGYGTHLTNKLVLTGTFSNRFSLSNQLTSHYFGLGIDIRRYFTNINKRFRIYGKVQTEAGIAFGSLHEDLPSFGLHGLLGAEYSVGKRVSLFFEAGYGTSYNLKNNILTNTPKGNFGIRIFF